MQRTLGLVILLALVTTVSCVSKGEFVKRGSPGTGIHRSGEAERAPVTDRGSGGNFWALFSDIEPADPAHYYNVFKMNGGRLISLSVMAESKAGAFDRYKLGVFDVTSAADVFGWRHEIGAPGENTITSPMSGSSFHYYLRFVPRGSEVLAQVQQVGGPMAVVSMNSLYKGRVRRAKEKTAKLCDQTYYEGYTGGPNGAILFFTERAIEALGDPSPRIELLLPKLAVYVTRRGGMGQNQRVAEEIPIANSNCSLIWNDAGGYWDAKKTQD